MSLKELQATVKVDITPRGAFDRYAQEMSMENLLKNGFFTTQKMPELKLYVKTLDDDSVMPKQKLLDLIEEWEKEQKKIQLINVKAQMMQQRANSFLNSDVEAQASQIADLQNQEVQPGV